MTLRSHMYRQLYAVASAGAGLGIVSDQMTKLANGQAVTLTREQLNMIGAHPSKDAVNLDDAASWVLGTDDTLTPAP